MSQPLRLLALAFTLLVPLAVLLWALRGEAGSGASGRPSAADASAGAHGAAELTAPTDRRSAEPRQVDRPPAVGESGAAKETLVRVIGRVEWPDGAPAAGAVVWGVEPWPDRRAYATVGREDGSFVLDLPPGRQPLAAKAMGSVPTRVELEVFGALEEQSGPTIVLDRGGRISGVVVDRAGAPVEGARVRCYATDESSFGNFVEGALFELGLGDVLTNAEGRFAFEGLHDAPYAVYVDTLRTPGMRAEPEQSESVQVGEELAFTLSPATRLAGVVRDARTGAPVTRFRVCGTEVDDEQGRFDVPVFTGGGFGVPPGVSPGVQARGYLPWYDESIELHEGDEVTGLEVLLEPDPDAVRLTISAVDDQGAPVSGLRCWGYGEGWSLRESTDGAALILEGLVAGRWQLSVRADGHALENLALELTAGSEERRELVLPRGRRARVRVLDARGAIARFSKLRVLRPDGTAPPYDFVYAEPQGTLIQVTSAHSFGGDPELLTDLSIGDGWLEGLPAGRYRLEAEVDGSTCEPAPLEISADRETAAELRPAE